MKIAIASDHGGFSLKGQIEEHLLARGLTVIDLGTDSEESVDYPRSGNRNMRYRHRDLHSGQQDQRHKVRPVYFD